MVESDRDRLAGDGWRLMGGDHTGVGRGFLFINEFKVTLSLNKALQSTSSHMMRTTAGFDPCLSNITSHCASGPSEKGRFRRALCLPESVKVDETIDDFLENRRLRIEIGDVLPFGNALS
jgi:hypothetical protein